MTKVPLPPQAILATAVAVALAASSACGGAAQPTAPAPAPGNTPPIANVYILPGATGFGANAFGDEPVVIHPGEQMRWRNADTVEHHVVADMPAFPEFDTTGTLAPGGERSFVMKTAGTTTIHCTIHPQMVGTLIVR